MNTYISLVGGCYLGNRDIGVPFRLCINTLNFVLSGKKRKSNEEEKKSPLCVDGKLLLRTKGKTGKGKRARNTSDVDGFLDAFRNYEN